ncbi:MAG: methylenetetrahydrofolate reductase [Acidimicrobiia bacterium]
MSKISDLLAAGPTFSFEFFPPRSEKAEATLARTLDELGPLGPSFISVTYGAGGTTRAKTHEVVVDVMHSRGITALAHCCCAGHTRPELAALIDEHRDGGVENVLALRGDPPADLGLGPGDLAHAGELVALVRERGDFAVGVAAHPEGHPSCPDRRLDRRRQADKLARADFGVTQFFYDIEHYLRFRDEVTSLGCTTPIIPGIMPVTNPAQVKRFAELSGADFPTWLADRIEAAGDQPGAVARLGVEVCTDLSQRLLDEGAPGLHFYTLNRAESVQRIWHGLGLRRVDRTGVRAKRALQVNDPSPGSPVGDGYGAQPHGGHDVRS